jgi:hypothetical protein
MLVSVNKLEEAEKVKNMLTMSEEIEFHNSDKQVDETIIKD